MIVNSNQAQESHQGFSPPFTRVVEIQISQRAKDFGMDTDGQVLGKAGPGLYQRMLLRGLTNKVQ